MSTRIYDLAKEMKISNKEMLEIIHAQGIEAKSHMSVLEDKDIEKIKNRGNGSSGTEEEKKQEAPAKTVIAPNGKAMPQGRPMPKKVVPQKLEVAEKPVLEEKNEGEVKQELVEETVKPAPEAEKIIVETVQPVHEVTKPVQEVAKPAHSAVKIHETAKPTREAAKPVHTGTKATNPATKVTEKPVATVKKEDRPVTADQILGRPEPQKFKIVKTHQEVAAKEAEDRAAREARRKAEEAKPKPAPRTDRGERRPYDNTRNNTTSSRSGSGTGTGTGRPYTNNGTGTGAGRPHSGPSTGRPSGTGTSRPTGTGTGRPAGGFNRGGEKPKADTGDVLVTKPSRGKRQVDHTKKDTPDRNGKFKARPLDLTKSAPKKHRKSRDHVADQVEENAVEVEALPVGSKIITVPITVKGLAEQIEKTSSQIIMALMKLGVMANINQNIDEDTAVLLGGELGVNIVVGKVDEDVVEEGLELFEDKEEDLVPRPPIITVMGHVDHGKTSLLDAIRKTNITDREAGGITQHIGASEVVLKGHKIVFLDTPGHEAFTAMRARGAHATDIAILVVAADDSVKPQTIESISHAKAAGVPIIVAINKIDKPGANPERVKQDLTEHGILVEDWGGDTICVPVSAKSGEGIVNLLEMILLQAEVLELKANPTRLAMGTVIEARLDKAKGPVATLLVLNGTLQSGMSVVAGTCSGRIRAMTNYKGDTIRKAGPATAVEILGLTDVPEAGDEFNAVKEDKQAREIAENRKIKLREEVMARNSSVTLEELFTQIEEGEVKELNLIIKADVQGSVGALTTSLEKLKNENVKVHIIHSGVGTVTESDIMLASTSKAIVIGFNVRPSTAISVMAERDGVEIRNYRIIYEAIEDIESAMRGMLDPVFKEVVLGKIEVRETFKVPGIGLIAGAYVLEGKVQRNAQVRLVRDGIVVHEGKISSLRRFKDDVKEVNTGYECGIGIDNYNDLKEGDIIEAFKMEEVERK